MAYINYSSCKYTNESHINAGSICFVVYR